jgi:hypothetical protein
MTQFARPDADQLIGNFSDEGGGTTDIFQSIDELSPNDTDYIRSPASPVNEVYVCRLSDVTDPVSSSSHVMRMRTATDLDAQEVLDFTQQLRQGYTNEGSQGTLIVTQTRASVSSTSFTTSEYTLSAGEADAITDYTDLFFRFLANRP